MGTNRYYAETPERKISNPPKRAVGGGGSKISTKASGPGGFPPCYGSRGSFGTFAREAFVKGKKRG